MTENGRVSAFAEPAPESTVTLRWTEGPYVGLAIVCRGGGSVPFGMYLELERELTRYEERAARYGRFGREVLVSWNLDDGEGQAIPATSEGMNAIPPELAWEVITRWLAEVSGVPVPLGQPSGGGEPSEEASTGGERPSGSRGSSRTRS